MDFKNATEKYPFPKNNTNQAIFTAFWNQKPLVFLLFFQNFPPNPARIPPLPHRGFVKKCTVENPLNSDKI